MLSLTHYLSDSEQTSLALCYPNKNVAKKATQTFNFKKLLVAIDIDHKKVNSSLCEYIIF